MVIRGVYLSLAVLLLVVHHISPSSAATRQLKTEQDGGNDSNGGRDGGYDDKDDQDKGQRRGCHVPFQMCKRTSDCLEGLDCRTYYGYPPLGDYPIKNGIPDCTNDTACPQPVKRCVPSYYKHFTVGLDQLTPSYNLISPTFIKKGCYTGRGNDWYMENFCCQDINNSPLCVGFGLNNDPICHLNPPKTCKAAQGRDGCCLGGMENDIPDQNTGTKCLIGFTNEIITNDVTAVVCCKGSFVYALPRDSLFPATFFTCLFTDPLLDCQDKDRGRQGKEKRCTIPPCNGNYDQGGCIVSIP